MATTVYFTPYVHGPKVKPTTMASMSVGTNRPRFGPFRRSFVNLAPSRQLDESGMLLVVEMVLCATLLGTAAAWFSGAEGALSVILMIDAALVAWLLVGTVVQTALKTRREAAAPATVANRWAYRVSNYRPLHCISELYSDDARPHEDAICRHIELEAVSVENLQAGDMIFVDAGQLVVADGTILDGTAVVDESAVTGQSDAVIRSADGEAAVLRETRVVSGRIIVEVSSRRGHPLDWMDHVPSSLQSSTMGKRQQILAALARRPTRVR